MRIFGCQHLSTKAVPFETPRACQESLAQLKSFYPQDSLSRKHLGATCLNDTGPMLYKHVGLGLALCCTQVLYHDLHSKCTGEPLLCQSQIRALYHDNDSTSQTSATPSHQPPANQVLACPVLRLAQRSWCHCACNEARHKVACKN